MDPVTSPQDSPTESTTPGRKRWAIGAGLAAALLAAGYAAAVVAVSGDVPEGTTVGGVDIGGMTTEQATAALEAEFADEATAPVPVIAGATETVIEPEAAGLAVDYQESAEQASGLVLNPARLIAHLQGDVALDLVTTVDDEALGAALDQVAAESAVEPTEPEIRYTDEADAELVVGQAGLTLDTEAAAADIGDAYMRDDAENPLPLPMQDTPPTVSDEDAQTVLAEFAEPAVALPVTVMAEDEEISVSPTDIARTLKFQVEDSTLEPVLNGKRLHRRLSDQLDDIEQPGRDARFRIKNDKPVIVKSRAGRTIDPDALSAAVVAVLPETTRAARSTTAELTRSPAEFTTADAKALNIKEKLSSFRQDFVPAQYRIINVGEAARRMNGTILKPGETFSMNDTVKERTPANGYTEGFIISGGRFREELGGGVSIITTATWTAGFYAPLERVEQHPHGLYISRYQAGLEATVAWGYLDLKMRNDTGNGVLITAERFNDGVLIEMWGTKKWDKVTATFGPRTNYTNFETVYDEGSRCVPSTGSRGFSIAVTRKRYIGTKVDKSETFYTTYKPTPNVVCGPKPKSED